MPETVYVTDNWRSRCRSAGGATYHTNADCMYVKPSFRQWDRAAAEERGFEQCESCKPGKRGGGDTSDAPGHKIRQAALEADR